MAEGVEDALFIQARGVAGAEFEDWISKLTSVLQSNDRGPTCLTLLRQLYVLTAATKYRRNLKSDVYKLLLSIVLEPEQGSLKVRLLAASVLMELSPSKHVVVSDFNPPVERSNIPYVLPVYLAQTNAREKLSQLVPNIVNWLTMSGQDEELSLAALCTLHSLCTHPRALEGVVEMEQLHSISLQLAYWLKHASKSSLPAPTTGISLFGGGGKKQSLPVKEIDGTPSQGIFTILNLGGYYSTDQLLNVSAFSALRRWLLTSIAGGSGTAPSPASSMSATPTIEQDGRSSSHTSLPSPSMSGSGSLTASLVSLGAGSRMRQGLKEASFQYCLRVIEQCERKPVRSEDSRLIDACLYECISILDLLCTLSTSLIHTVFPKMRILYSRVTQDPISNSRLLLILLQFFVNHENMKSTMDPERRQASLERKIQYIEQEIERQQKARAGVEQLAKVYQEQPDFVDEKGAEDVNRQLIEADSMLNLLKANHYKLLRSHAEISDAPRPSSQFDNYIVTTSDKHGQTTSILKIPPDQMAYLQDEYQPAGYDIKSNSSRRSSKKPAVPAQLSFNGGASYAGGGGREEEEEERVEEGFADDDDEYDDDNAQYDYVGQCTVLYEYAANEQDELDINPGDVINIIDKYDAEWWQGELNGKVGIFPASYVQDL